MYELHEFHLQSSINFAVQEIKPGQPVAELIKHNYKKLWNYLSSMTMDIFLWVQSKALQHIGNSFCTKYLQWSSSQEFL